MKVSVYVYYKYVFSVCVNIGTYLHTHTGDGICSSPEEYAGFGRFGCIKDCGRFTNTTKIYINMQDFFDQVKAVDRWDVSKTTPYTTRQNPRFTYNIWSE
jgi:hypothetical protein